MGGKSSIPTSYSLNTNSTLSGGVDLDLDEIRVKELPDINVNGNMAVTDLPEVALRLKELPAIDVTTNNSINLDSNSKVDLNSDNKLTLDSDSKVALDTSNKVDLNSNSKVDVDTRNQVELQSDSKVALDSNSKLNLKSDSKLDLGLDNIRLKELPRIDFQLGFKPMRISFPLNYRFSLSLFGFKVFDFNACGENMIIVEGMQTPKPETPQQDA